MKFNVLNQDSDLELAINTINFFFFFLSKRITSEAATYLRVEVEPF